MARHPRDLPGNSPKSSPTPTFDVLRQTGSRLRRGGAVAGVLLTGLLVASCTASLEPVDPEDTPIPMRAPDLTVDPSGDASEYTTIQAAVDAAEPGDAIEVLAGEYDEDISVEIGGSADETLLVYGDGTATIRGTVDVSAPYVELVGLAFDGEDAEGDARGDSAVTVSATHLTARDLSISNYAGWGIEFEAGTGDDLQQASNGTVTDSYIYNSSGGIVVLGDSLIENNEIERINLHDDDEAPGDAFRVFGSDTTFRGNHVHGSIREEIVPAHADMIQSWDEVGAPVTGILVEDNLFTGWYNQGLMLENDYFGPDGEYLISDWVVRNNVFQGFESTGIHAGKENGGIPNMTVEHNVFVGNPDDGGYFGIAFYGEGGTGTVRNNIIVNVTDTTYGASDGATMDASHTLTWESARPDQPRSSDRIEVDPRFVDPETFDYRLSAGSPAINAGARSSTETDANGTPRPQGGAPDLGPFERDD
ncbi:choice-of-anchor Q domain-containing protein [Planctomonas psychrotolerans]|uniref:choice-of-anchor Q domain-containing protein n=1 Tax=Planctomonas psychrotolerans TaxID=2528712 RepID=UPI00123ACBBE|nr:choice-of-anchor Q domain-containing protein [Planctomonas psychrotolerans]